MRLQSQLNLLELFIAIGSRWIAAQQFSCRDAAQAGDSPADISGRNQSFQDKEKGIFGCEHYKRNCKVRASCCGHLFPCRFCHDKVSDHSMDRWVLINP